MSAVTVYQTISLQFLHSWHRLFTCRCTTI